MSSALVLVFLLAVAAAASAQPLDRPRPKSVTVTTGHELKKTNEEVGGLTLARLRRQDNGSTLLRLVSAASGPLRALLGAQSAVGADDVRYLGGGSGAGPVLSLLAAASGSSSGPRDQPADSDEDLQDLEV